MGPLTAPFNPAPPLRPLITLAVPICRRGDLGLPPRRPGHPVAIPEWAIAVMILVAVATRRTTKSAQDRYRAAHAVAFVDRFGLDRFPVRRTDFARDRTASLVMTAAAAAHTTHAADRGHIHVRCAAAAQTRIAAAGPAWHQAPRARGERPRGTDDAASWSRSAHDGGVSGHGLEAIGTAPRAGTVWPMLGSLDPGHVRAAKTFPAKVPALPHRTRSVLVDIGYDGNDLGAAVESDDAGRRTGRRLVGPQQVRHQRSGPGPKKTWRETRRRRRRREHRDERRQFSQSRFGRALDQRRGKTVEPFFGRFKDVFGLQEHVWHKGLENNRTMMTAALLLYQILLVFNRIKGRANAEVKWRLDLL